MIFDVISVEVSNVIEPPSPIIMHVGA